MLPTRARALLASQIHPLAQRIDRDPEALARALEAPPAVSEADFRAFQEDCAAASGALAFLQTQHQSATALIARGHNDALKSRLLPALASGESRAGIAFSHLRRPGPSALTATPTRGGWRLRGHTPWVTGWGFFDRCVTAAALPDGRTLFVTHPLVAVEGLQVGAPRRLAALEVAGTVPLTFDDLRVPAADHVATHPADWIQRRDAASAASKAPFVLGCARAAVEVLREAEARRGLPAIAAAAAALGDALEACRAEAYAAMDSGDPARGVAARAAAIALAGRCAFAAVIACSATS